MLRVTLDSGAEVLDLNEISSNGEGVQAVAGLTGFGLPPVSVHWLEGAGDGAIHRHTRALPRDIDIPLEVFALSQHTLRDRVNKISRVTSGEMTVRIYGTSDDFSHHEVKAHRTGGGTYATGVDSDGQYYWSGVITVRAGSPFLTQSTSTVVNRNFGSGTSQTYSLSHTNPGTAPAYPVVELHGDPIGFTLNINGRLTIWERASSAGVYINTETGIIREIGGSVNYYDGVQGSPAFEPLKAGWNNVSVSVTYPVAKSPADGVAVSLHYQARDWMVV